MKELSIEEKAKAYDKALEIARQYWNDRAMPIGTNFKLERMFPELKESKDERIRKAIVKMISDIDGGSPFEKYGIIKKEALAWLEKQGEQKLAVDTKVVTPKFRVGDIVKIKSQPMLSPRKITSIGKDCYWCEDRGCIGFAWEDDYEIVEQNPDWSEEDERMYRGLHNLIYSTPYCDSRKELSDWLKSIKDRVQPQNGSVTDEELAQAKKDAYNGALDKIEYHSGEPTFDDGWDAAIWYLKKRIEKFAQQTQKGEF